MSQTVEPTSLDAAFYGGPGGFAMRFRFVTVSISYSVPQTYCLPCLGEHIQSERSGILAQVEVWLNSTDLDGSDQHPESFPFSILGFPFGYATPDQVAAIFHWASLLLEEPAPRNYNKPITA